MLSSLLLFPDSKESRAALQGQEALRGEIPGSSWIVITTSASSMLDHSDPRGIHSWVLEIIFRLKFRDLRSGCAPFMRKGPTLQRPSQDDRPDCNRNFCKQYVGLQWFSWNSTQSPQKSLWPKVRDQRSGRALFRRRVLTLQQSSQDDKLDCNHNFCNKQYVGLQYPHGTHQEFLRTTFDQRSGRALFRRRVPTPHCHRMMTVGLQSCLINWYHDH